MSSAVLRSFTGCWRIAPLRRIVGGRGCLFVSDLSTLNMMCLPFIRPIGLFFAQKNFGLKPYLPFDSVNEMVNHPL